MKFFLQRFIYISAIVILASSVASGAELSGVLDTTARNFLDGAKTWKPIFTVYAFRLFWTLTAINIVFTFCYGAVSGYSLSSFFSDFLRLVITTGFFYWLLLNGPAIGEAIIRSFSTMGAQAAGVSGYGNNISPSGVVGLSWDIITAVIESFSEQSWSTWLVNIFLSIFLSLVFAFIAVQMLLLEISAYILIYAGLWYLGLGAIAYTRDIVINYLKSVLGVAIQIMCFYLIIGLGFNMIPVLINLSNATQQIQTDDGIIAGAIETIKGLLAILIYSIILLELLKKVPTMVSGVIAGGGVGSLATAGGVYSSLASAAHVAAGAAVAATGAGMALAAAYKQAGTQMASKAGGGGSGGESGGGSSGGGGGLAGVMNRGLSRTAGTMANLVRGAASGMKESATKNSIGGKMADKINANASAAKAAKDAEGAGGKTDSAGGQQASQASGNDTQGAEAGGSGGEDGSSNNPFDGGGAISGSDAGGDGGASSHVTRIAQQASNDSKSWIDDDGNRFYRGTDGNWTDRNGNNFSLGTNGKMIPKNKNPDDWDFY